MNPSGETCKCGAAKKATAFFCDVCTGKLPGALLCDMARTQSWPGFRQLIRRAVIILRLPQTRNEQRKKFYVPA